MVKQLKKVVALCALTCVFALAANAQNFYQVTGTEEDVARKGFFVQGAEVEMKTNVVVYNKVSEDPRSYLICYLKGVKQTLLTVAEKKDISVSVQEVDSVGMNTLGHPKVFFVGGYTYETPDSTFFGLQKGQKVEFTEILGLTQIFQRVRTVPRDTPVSKKDGALLAEL